MALDKKLRSSDKTAIERLIEEKVTNYVVVNKYDLIKVDELPTQITAASIDDLHTIKISFNEDVESIPLSNIVLTVNGSKRDTKSLSWG